MNSQQQPMIKRLYELLRILWGSQLLRFFVTGGINALFGFTVYSVLILINIHYSVASFLSTIVGIVFNFFTTGRIVFHSANPRLFLKFLGVYGISYSTNLLLLSIFNHFNFNMVFAGAILLLPIALFTYLLNKYLVFSQ